MACEPGGELQPALHDERVDFLEVRVGEGQHLAVPVEPGVHEVAGQRARLNEAEGAGQVVQMPAKAAIVKVDDLYLVVFHQQVG